MKKKILDAFTLVELIISIIITTIILGGLMLFISDIYKEIDYSIKKTDSISNIIQIKNKIKEINSFYNSGTFLIDNNSNSGSDILLFRKNIGEDNQDGYIFALINFENKTIDGSGNIDNIEKKFLAYRKLSEKELQELDSDPNKIYNYKFQLDKIFNKIVIKNFQIDFYNSGKIGEIQLDTFLDYENNKSIKKYSNLDNKNIEKFIFNF